MRLCRFDGCSAGWRAGAGALTVFAALAAAPAVLAEPTPGKTIFNVQSYYSGSGTWDAAIQAAVADAKNAAIRDCRGAIVFFPEGRYEVQSSINLMGLPTGIDFVGAGASPYVQGVHDAEGKCPETDTNISTIIHLTTPGEALFEIEALFLTFTDLILEGPGITGQNTTLVQTTSSPQKCTSTIKFQNVHFRYADVGLALGAPGAITATCNSEITLKSCGFVSLDRGLVTNNDQSHNILVEQFGANACRKVFDIDHGGGNFSFNTGTFTSCGGAGINDWIFDFSGGGPNTGNAKIVNAHFDAGPSGPCWRFIRLSGDHRVSVDTLVQTVPIEALEACSSWPPCYEPVIEVRAGSLTLNECRFQSYPVVRFANRAQPWLTKAVRFRDCALAKPAPYKGGGDEFDISRVFTDGTLPSEPFSLLFDACTDIVFNPIPRWTNEPTW